MPRKGKPQDSSPYDGIRGRWEAASLAQFLKLFQYKFNFACVTTQELEEALVDGGSVIIADTCARLLRFLTGSSDIIIGNFEKHFKIAALEAGSCPELTVLLGNQTWNTLGPEEKVLALKWLVDRVLEHRGEELKEHLDETWRPDDMRGLCAGQDAFNNVYWYLDDLRLYRENNVKKASKKEWECVCVTLQDWVGFLKQFRKTNNPQERELYTYLNLELFPLIENQLRELGDRGSKGRLPDNEDLVRRERTELELAASAMIKESKEKRDKKNGSSVTVKVEPQQSCQAQLSQSPQAAPPPPPQPPPAPLSQEVALEEEVAPDGEEGSGVLGPSDGESGEILGPSTPVATVATGSVEGKEGPSTGPGSASTSSVSVDAGSAVPSATCVNVPEAEMCSMEGAREAKPGENVLSDNQVLCDSVKTEETSNNTSNHEFSSEHTNQPIGGLGGTMSTSAPGVPPNDGVQPLPSNVINKQPGTMEAQYMQQQSQIFVFSTTLANKAAESVLQGQFPSIIAYHCAQPGTKKYLEKHPLKMNQFIRQNPAQWLNNLAQMKQKSGPGNLKNINSLGTPNPGFSTGSGTMVGDLGTGPWSQSNSPITSMANINTIGSGGNNLMQTCANNVLPGCSVGSPMAQSNANSNSVVVSSTRQMKSGDLESPLLQTSSSLVSGSPNSTGPNAATNAMLPMSGQLSPSLPPASNAMIQGPTDSSALINSVNSSNPMMGHPQPSLTGVKVPDENLTPQQRQHREEQLATLRKMQQILFPEHQLTNPDGLSIGPGAGNPTGPLGPGQPQPMMSGPQGMMAGQQSMMVGQSPHGLRTSPIGDGGSVGGQKNMMMGQGVMPVGMGSGSNQGSPVGPAAQVEWQKLQQQFYEDRKKKVPSGSGNVPLGCGSPVIGGSPMGPGGSMCTGGPLGGTGPSVGSGNVMGPGVVGPGIPLGQGVSTGAPGTSLPVGSMGPRGMAPVRMHGPPPPYHQTTRSASVPTAMPSPTPNSPNNPTSNLSLPSPRAASGLHSPAESSRHFQMVGNPRLPGPSPTSMHNTPLGSPNAGRPLNPSNPGTPLSAHQSPSTCRKDNGPNGSGDFPPSTQSSGTQSVASAGPCQQPQVDGMFGRTLQSFAQQKQQQSNQNKEPNLMPVPSPQQIQYLNTFEGQELTIQKQPNTSLGDTDMSPTLTSNLDGSLPTTVPDSAGPHLSGASTPLTPSSVDVSHRYGGPHTPHTPTDINRFPIPSPHTPGPPEKCQRFPGRSPQSQGSRTPGMESCLPAKSSSSSVDGVVRFSSTSPQGGDGMGPPRFPGSAGSGSGTPGHPGGVSTPPIIGNPGQQNFVSGPGSMSIQKGSSHFPEVSPPKGSADISPTGPSFTRSRPDNMPLDPDGNGSGSSDGKVSHFDPISSMAQMSQQLTSGVASSPGQNGSLMGGMGSVGGPSGPQMIPFDSGLHPVGDGMLHCPPTSVGGGSNHPGNHPGNAFGPHPYGPVGGGSVVTSQGGSSPLMMPGGVSMMPSCSMSHSASPKSMMGAPPRGSPPMVPYSPPALGTQRVQNRPPGPRGNCVSAPGPYNGANVQVKPSAPNTIQYLPARPQTNSGPRGPPSLEFLQRFANPLSNLDNKVPTHNLQYFPNSSQSNSVVGGPNVPISMSGPMGPMGGMNAPMGGMMPGPQGPMCSQMGPNSVGMGSMNGPADGQSNVVGHGGQMAMHVGQMGGQGGGMVGAGGQIVGQNSSSGGPVGVHGGGGGMQMSGGPNSQMGGPMGGSGGPMGMGGGMGSVMGGPPGGMGGPIGGPMGVPGGPMSGPGGPMGIPMGGPVGSPMGGPPMGGPGGPVVGPMGASGGSMVAGGASMGVGGGSVGGPVGGMAGTNGPMMGPNVSMSVVNGPMNTGMGMNPGGIGMGPMGVMGPLRGGPMGGQMGGAMVGQPLGPRTHGGMMRGGPAPGMGGGMFGGGGQGVGNEQMFGPMSGGSGQMMSGPSNAQLFVPGAKSSPMGLGGAPDASQPLPPSMGQGGNFKSSPFIGPTTSDPNYAQQFHNFQQQLYATNTRSQMNNQAMTSNQSFFGAAGFK